ncbi:MULTISPECIES: hypothetical protein [Pseudoalteromonas]|uniref:hypothetical protein n=2 Tax=Pseudoalteromonas TaxID=53246 RepID=UPI000FFF290E|nr:MULTISPECIES: hypothetical protein [Pseudoalteromonas]NKC21222.1 hypothetical protein [Pseudoalteromonas galatheae]RXE86027.1 hypothetical protein DRB05_14000 [Pseudoalteromonas sp. A757]
MSADPKEAEVGSSIGIETNAYDNDVPQQLSQFDSSTFEEAVIQGNRDVQVNNYFSNADKKPLKYEALQLRTFPKIASNEVILDDVKLAELNNFLICHNWLIIEKNNENAFYLSEAIAAALQQTEISSYYIRHNSCRMTEYLESRFPYVESQHAYVIRQPIEDLESFERFIETRENLNALTSKLKARKATLLMVLDSKGDSDCPRRIQEYLRFNSISAMQGYWQPAIHFTHDPLPAAAIDNDDWLGCLVISLTCWFNNMPLVLFQTAIAKAFDHKLKQAKEMGEGVEALTHAYARWQQDPDAFLKLAGLELSSSSGLDICCIRLSSLKQASVYREKLLTNNPFQLAVLSPIIEEVIFDQDITNELLDIDALFSDLAYLYLKLSEAGVMTVSSDYLLKIFERYRQCQDSKIIHFISFVRALSYQDRFKSAIDEFIYQLLGQVEKKEKDLISISDLEIHIENWVPAFKSTYENKLKEVVCDFKNHLYFLFNTLAYSIEFESESEVLSLEYIFSKSYELGLDKGKKCPSFAVLRYYFSGYLYSDASHLLKILKSILSDSEQCVLTLMIVRIFVFSLMHRVLEGNNQLDDKATSYLITLIFEEGAEELIYQLLAMPSLNESLKKRNITAFLTASIYIKQTLIQAQYVTDESAYEHYDMMLTELDEKFKRLNQLFAIACTRKQYEQIKADLRIQRDKALAQYRDCRADKKLRMLLKLKKGVLSEAIKQFKKPRRESYHA